MQRAPLPTTLLVLVAAALLGAAGYGLYAIGVDRGLTLAATPASPSDHPHGDGSGDRAAMTAAAPATALTGQPASTARAGAAATARSTAQVADGARVPLYWHDPMNPGVKFDKPGKSPFMDMDLVPVYPESAGADAGVSISASAQQSLGVRTAEVTKGGLTRRIEATGSVGWNERHVEVVAARAAGFVEKLHVRAPFDPVAKGQALAELYVPDWIAAQEEFLSVRRMRGTDLAPLIDGARQRMRQAGMTDEQIARVEAGGKVQPRVTVTAPISGVVGELGVREGSAVSMGMPLFRINGLASVWVNAEVPEAMAADVRRGDDVEVTTPSGSRRNGRVAVLLPEINATTRTLKVRVEIANADRQLVPGMFATLRFKPAARPDMLLIPSEAVIATGERSIVMLATDQGGYTPVEIERGLEADGQTEIRKGLRAGQRVVVSGQFLLDSEARLKGIETQPRPSAAAAHDHAAPEHRAPERATQPERAATPEHAAPSDHPAPPGHAGHSGATR